MGLHESPVERAGYVQLTGPAGHPVYVRPTAVDSLLPNPERADPLRETRRGETLLVLQSGREQLVQEPVDEVLARFHAQQLTGA